MTSFADKLLTASEDESLSKAELQQLLRRAALRLRDQNAISALDRLCTINEQRARNGEPSLGLDAILDDWSISQGEGAFDEIDEDTETKGSA